MVVHAVAPGAQVSGTGFSFGLLLIRHVVVEIACVEQRVQWCRWTAIDVEVSRRHVDMDRQGYREAEAGVNEECMVKREVPAR